MNLHLSKSTYLSYVLSNSSFPKVKALIRTIQSLFFAVLSLIYLSNIRHIRRYLTKSNQFEVAGMVADI